MSVLVMMEMQSSSCASVITNGGANRMMLPCVGFARSPFSISLRQMFQAVLLSSESLITMAFNKPLPRTLKTMELLSIYDCIAFLNLIPSFRAF